MRLGVFAKTFDRRSVDECLLAVRGAGIDCAQFNLSIASLPTVPEQVPDSVIETIRAATDATGVSLPAISGTFNAAHPDPVVRRSFIARFPALCTAAVRLGIPVITLSSGSRDPEDMWRWHPDNTTDAAWEDSRNTLRAVSAMAEDCGLLVAVEPEHSNVVSTAELAVRMLDEVDNSALKIVYDAANLLDPDTFDQAEARRRISADVATLGKRIALAHAKELTAGRAPVPAGSGLLPWQHIVDELTAHGYDGALVIHGLAEAQVPLAVATLSATSGPCASPRTIA